MINRLNSRERVLRVAAEKLEGASKSQDLYRKFEASATARQTAHGKSVYYTPLHISDKDPVVSYAMTVRDDLAALVVGLDHGALYKAEWFAVHPNYRNTNVLSVTIDELQRRYDEIKLQAGATEKEYGTSDEEGRTIKREGVEKGRRRKALRRIYERFGFSSDRPDWVPENMTWRRQQKEI